MNKKRFLVVTLVCMLAFSLIPSYEASALNEDGSFVSTGERDTWVLKIMKDYPYYIILTGGSLQTNIDVLTATMLLAGKDTYWIGDQNVLVFAFADGRYISGGCYIVFAKNKSDADTYSTNTAKTGSSVFGPFFSGSTDTTRSAALKRIIDGTTSYRATGNKNNPWS